MSEVPVKRCTGPCRQEYPATPEYFHRNNQQGDGFNPRCKKCKATYNKLYYSRPEVQKHRNEYYDLPEVRKQIRDYHKEYYYRPEVKERSKAYRDQPEVKDRISSYGKKYLKRPSVKEHKKEYNNKQNVRLRRRAEYHRREAQKKLIAGTYTPEQIQDQLKRQKHKCYYCQKKLQKTKGKYIYHIEHTFPLSRVAGTDIPANSIDYLVLSCPTCNLSKGNKFPWEWIEGGRLL